MTLVNEPRRISLFCNQRGEALDLVEPGVVSGNEVRSALPRPHGGCLGQYRRGDRWLDSGASLQRSHAGLTSRATTSVHGTLRQKIAYGRALIIFRIKPRSSFAPVLKVFGLRTRQGAPFDGPIIAGLHDVCSAHLRTNASKHRDSRLKGQSHDCGAYPRASRRLTGAQGRKTPCSNSTAFKASVPERAPSFSSLATDSV